jgi:hypothetical protein
MEGAEAQVGTQGAIAPGATNEEQSDSKIRVLRN